MDYKVSSELYEENNNITKLKPSVSTDNVVSTFKFSIPKLATVDSDGDLEVQRKVKHEEEELLETIEIEHSTSTALSLVGLQIWRGAFLLADWLIYNSKYMTGDCMIMELGSGVGLTSIVASMFGPVICTDINSGNILKLLESNVSRNNSYVKFPVSVLELNFFSEKIKEDIIKKLPAVKIILAADVIYDDDITDAFITTTRKLLKLCPDGAVYVALEKRYVFTITDCDTCAPCYEYFLECLLMCKDIKAEELSIDFPQYFQYNRVKELVLWKITLKE